MAQVLDASAIEDAVGSMARAIAARKGDGPWAIIGIRRGGELLAKRIAEALGAIVGRERVVLGFVDITLYRDDGFGPNDWPQIGKTDLPFAPRDYTVVLVDDVLYTGRTVRSALDVILDYGRPRAVRLAVLVDRGLRELPIAADFVGHAIATTATQHVDVRADAVHVNERKDTSPDASSNNDSTAKNGHVP
jgi:pyrimidine operon attenuation protein / uracil phosphoribosyltransferase